MWQLHWLKTAKLSLDILAWGLSIGFKISFLFPGFAGSLLNKAAWKPKAWWRKTRESKPCNYIYSRKCNSNNWHESGKKLFWSHLLFSQKLLIVVCLMEYESLSFWPSSWFCKHLASFSKSLVSRFLCFFFFKFFEVCHEGFSCW